jgi:hypothetical protein
MSAAPDDCVAVVAEDLKPGMVRVQRGLTRSKSAPVLRTVLRVEDGAEDGHPRYVKIWYDRAVGLAGGDHDWTRKDREVEVLKESFEF